MRLKIGRLLQLKNCSRVIIPHFARLLENKENLEWTTNPRVKFELSSPSSIGRGGTGTSRRVKVMFNERLQIDCHLLEPLAAEQFQQGVSETAPVSMGSANIA